MDPAMIGSVTAIVTVVGVAVWRFTRLESQMKHQHHCNTTLVKSVARVGSKQKETHALLVKHIANENRLLEDIHHKIVREPIG